MTSLNKKRPVQEFRGVGNIKVAVWRREFEGRFFYTYGPERGYKDKDGKWQSTSSFSPEEWDIVHRLIESAEQYVADAQAKDAAVRAEADQLAE